MRWVRQEDAEGCAVAALAMLTDESYGDVKAEIDAQDGHGHDGDWNHNGVTRMTIDRFLTARGFYLQRIYESWHESGWPPGPWAPQHVAQVVQPFGNQHYVVMDSDGVVLDPLREGTFRLGDWPKINHVVGLIRPARIAPMERLS